MLGERNFTLFISETFLCSKFGSFLNPQLSLILEVFSNKYNYLQEEHLFTYGIIVLRVEQNELCRDTPAL